MGRHVGQGVTVAGFRIQWALEDGVSDRARAVQHALVIVQAAGVATWDELAEVLSGDPERAAQIREGVNLDLDELENLDAHEQTLRGLRRKSDKRASVVTTIAECATCLRWGYVAGASIPKKCPFTSGCTGTVTKIGPPDHTLRARST